MYDLLFVRKRRRRRVAALVSLFSAMGITSLVIISFLGRTVGTFTVSLSNSSVTLALSDEESFKSSTSYLKIDNIPSTYQEYSYEYFKQGGFDIIDTEAYANGIAGSDDDPYMNYLKYTFYVKNVGNTTARYKLSINIDDSAKSVTGKSLEDTLRVMVFENDPTVSDSHDFKVYAKPIKDKDIYYLYEIQDIEGNKTNQVFVTTAPNPVNGIVREDAEHPLAQSFVKDPENTKTIITSNISDFVSGDMMRYTVVYWLEGEVSVPEYDEGGKPVKQEGAKLKLSITIKADSDNSKK